MMNAFVHGTCRDLNARGVANWGDPFLVWLRSSTRRDFQIYGKAICDHGNAPSIDGRRSCEKANT